VEGVEQVQSAQTEVSVLAAQETVELVLHHLFLDRLLLGLEEVAAVATKEQPELVELVVAEMVLTPLQLLVEVEQQILAVELAAVEVLMGSLLQTAVLVVPVLLSSRFPIPITVFSLQVLLIH
jgi:hypothetical protein